MKKQIVLTAIISALVASIATNTVRDTIYVKNNGKLMSKITSVLDILQDNCIFDFDEQKMEDLAAYAVSMSVDDPYTVYFPAEDYKIFSDDISSTYKGIGITLSYSGDTYSITEITPNASADKAGVKRGDVLIGVDDIKSEESNLSDIVSYIKSHEIGEEVLLHILRDGNGIDISVPVAKVQQISASCEMIDSSTGYIKLNDFKGNSDETQRTAFDDFEDCLSQLKDSGMTKLILDLRDNPGGDLGVCGAIADEFLDDGQVITYTEDKKGHREYMYATGNSVDCQIVIITNGESASASEALTGALRDNKRAVSLGEKTFGKGIAQRRFAFSDGSGMNVTIARYYTPSEVCIHGVGIEPDIPVELPEGKTSKDYTIQTDPQIQAAYKELNK